MSRSGAGGGPEPGGCAAIRLPAGGSIARAARTSTAETLRALGLGMSADDIDNATLMVSELATNALQHGSPRSPDGRLLPSHPIELWIYTRGTHPDGTAGHGGRSELVVKVFDGSRDWLVPDPADALDEHGRGLVIIEALTGGRWGHHLTRSRLGDPAAPGKVTWFGLPIPPVRPPPPHTGAAHAAAELHALLAGRAITRLIRRDERGLSVLSVKRDLTVWCEAGGFRWRRPGGGLVRLPRTDITETCEQVVELHEAMAREPVPSAGGR